MYYFLRTAERCIFFVILTVSRQLHHHLFIVGLGSAELVLKDLFLLLTEHLGAVAGPLELLIACLQALDKLAVFLRTHAGELNTHTNISLTASEIEM